MQTLHRYTISGINFGNQCTLRLKGLYTTYALKKLSLKTALLLLTAKRLLLAIAYFEKKQELQYIFISSEDV
jgi:hypothetical protein